MGSRNMSRRMLPWLAMMMVLVRGDFDKDQKQCGDTLVGLATCLPYVSGEAKAPTMDCCAKLKPVLDKSKVCLCILVKDRDEPSLGVKINGSLALGLPDSCHLPANITECPKLMNMSYNSPEAKIFEDYGKNVKKSDNTTVTPSGNGSSGSLKNDVGRGKKWLVAEKIWGALYIIIMVLFQMV
ncbi:putative bifunctional inhibitor/plant lipid transfer protein/seed storage helical [Helianthus annuus]|nr:putative bifunctional inhibitor/plant lipid transfer protein/seed storage helical [Helianthus annuus]